MNADNEKKRWYESKEAYPGDVRTSFIGLDGDAFVVELWFVDENENVCSPKLALRFGSIDELRKLSDYFLGLASELKKKG